MDKIIVPSGVDAKQLDKMMKGQAPGAIPIQVPKHIQDAQKKYIEDGLVIYTELMSLADDGDIFAKTLSWLMKPNLPFDTVQEIDKQIEELREGDDNE